MGKRCGSASDNIFTFQRPGTKSDEEWVSESVIRPAMGSLLDMKNI